ncbi:hypothetical protein CR513_48155, partial [Mucuna pruriens]
MMGSPILLICTYRAKGDPQTFVFEREKVKSGVTERPKENMQIKVSDVTKCPKEKSEEKSDKVDIPKEKSVVSEMKDGKKEATKKKKVGEISKRDFKERGERASKKKRILCLGVRGIKSVLLLRKSLIWVVKGSESDIHVKEALRFHSPKAFMPLKDTLALVPKSHMCCVNDMLFNVHAYVDEHSLKSNKEDDMYLASTTPTHFVHMSEHPHLVSSLNMYGYNKGSVFDDLGCNVHICPESQDIWSQFMTERLRRGHWTMVMDVSNSWRPLHDYLYDSSLKGNMELVTLWPLWTTTPLDDKFVKRNLGPLDDRSFERHLGPFDDLWMHPPFGCPFGCTHLLDAPLDALLISVLEAIEYLNFELEEWFTLQSTLGLLREYVAIRSTLGLPRTSSE